MKVKQFKEKWAVAYHYFLKDKDLIRQIKSLYKELGSISFVNTYLQQRGKIKNLSNEFLCDLKDLED